MTTTALRSTTLKIDQSIKDRVKRLAETRQRPASGLMVDAIRDYVDREEKREAFRQDGIRAWKEYELTGLHATFEEADAWLAQLEKGHDVEPPACHV